MNNLKEYSYIEVQKILRRNGFNTITSGKGDHIKFWDNDNRCIIIPRRKSVNKMLFLRIIKENNLTI